MQETASGADLVAIGERIAGWARHGEQVEAVVVRGSDTEVSVHDGQVESFSSATSAGVGVRVVTGGKQGFAYAGTLEPAALEEVLAEARDNATFGTEDPHLGLATPDGVAVPDLALFDERLFEVSPERKIDLALELERAVLAADPRVGAVESTDYADGAAEAAVVSSTGIRSFSRETACYVSTSPLAGEGDDMQSGWGYSVGRHPGALDVERAAADAADRATRMLGATKPRSERVTVVLDPFVTAQFLAIIASTLNGEAVLKGRSLFAERMGHTVASPLVTLVDDPTDARAYSASATDGEGLACRRNVLLQDGVLQGFLHDTYSARALGAVPTGSAVRGGFKSTPSAGAQAVQILPGMASAQEILASVGDGVLVQEVVGIHSGVNPVSGDFSTGALGVRIRGGERAEPLREFTIASTLQRMLQQVVAVGADVEWLPMDAAGVTLAITDLTLSGS